MKNDPDYSDVEIMLTRRFNKFLKRREKEKNQQAKMYNNKSDFGSSNSTCFGCGKQVHIKVEYPNLVHKVKGLEKRNSKKATKHIFGRQ